MARRVPSPPLVALCLLSVAAIVVTIAACGTEAVGVDSCRKIETMRCERAVRCGISLDTPTHRGESDELATAACIRYYDDACLHGLVVAEDPGALVVDACVEAIRTGSCEGVRAPESLGACAWMKPPAPTVTPDAAADALGE